MVTQWTFTFFIGLLILQRLLEIRLSQRNEARILAAGGTECFASHYPVMVLLHTSWFICMLLEVWLINPEFSWLLCLLALLFTMIGQILRYAAIHALGWRWSTRIMVLPQADPVEKGIYRYLRHPNYLGVILEIAAVPLLHSAYWTSLVFSLANGALLWVRIRAEERALQEYNHYDDHFKNRPRFWFKLPLSD